MKYENHNPYYNQRGQPMSGRDEVIWSKEPPGEPGFYFCKHSFEGADEPFVAQLIETGTFTRKPPVWFCIGIDEPFSHPAPWLFGPRIPSPSELTAAAKRVEELEGQLAALKEVCGIHWANYETAKSFADGTLVVVRRDAGPIQHSLLTWYRNDWDEESAVGRLFLPITTTNGGGER